MNRPLTLKLNTGHVLLALLICAVALALRVWVVMDRAQHDPLFIPQAGNDMHTYFSQAELVLDGSPVWIRQPGVAYAYATLMRVVGRSEPMLMLALGGLDALAAGLLIAVGWLFTRRLWAGYLVGGLYAVYPISVFYAGTLLADPFATLLLIVAFLLFLWQQERLTWWRTILLGLLTGFMWVTRNNLVPVMGLFALYLLWLSPRRRRLAAHLGVMTLLALVVYRLLAPAGSEDVSWQLYAANNRDASGTGGSSVALEAVDTGYWQALAQDIVLDPVRFGGLLLRKWAIAWSNVEFGNNIDFYEVRAFSPVLQWLPGDFTWVALAAGVGLVALWPRDRRLFWLMLAILAWLTVSLIVTFPISRLRLPAIVPLLLLATLGVVGVVEAIQARQWPFMRAATLALGGGLLALVVFPWLAFNTTLPPKRVYADLPTDAVRLDAVYGDSGLRLVGWRPLPYWAAPQQGWQTSREAYTVELFWATDRILTTDYNFYLAYADGDTRYAGVDRTLGSVAFPPVTSSQWQPDRIYGEIVGFRTREMPPLAHSGEVRVGVYQADKRTGALTNIPMTAPSQNLYAILQPLAYFPPQPLSADVADLTPLNIVFGSAGGDQILLNGLRLPATAQPGATITISLAWRALSDVQQQYRLFLHVMDASDQLAQQGDGLPVAGLLTQNWRPGDTYIGDIPITMPTTPGIYHVYLGLIENVTRDRLYTDAPDARPLIATITVVDK